MAVYMIRAGLNGPVKIGKADNPAKRMFGFQTAHHEVLHLLRVWEGGHKEEAALHARFKHLWLRGEWFTFCSAMLDDAGLTRSTHGLTYRPNDPVIPVQSIVEVIERLGGAVAVAKMTGTTSSTVRYWGRCGSIPAKYWLILVQHAEAIGASCFDINTLMHDCSVKKPSISRLRLVPKATPPDLFSTDNTTRMPPASEPSPPTLQEQSA